MSDDQKIFIERRAHPRYYIEGLALNSDGSVCAHLIDIGIGGLAFRYVADNTTWSETQNEQGTISGQDFYMEKIPLITVSETDLYNGLYTIKRHSVKFGNLTPDQQYKIEKMITDHAADLKKTEKHTE